jgi:hypothetical protein
MMLRTSRLLLLRNPVALIGARWPWSRKVPIVNEHLLTHDVRHPLREITRQQIIQSAGWVRADETDRLRRVTVTRRLLGIPGSACTDERDACHESFHVFSSVGNRRRPQPAGLLVFLLLA